MDADGQDDPEKLPTIIEASNEDDYIKKVVHLMNESNSNVIINADKNVSYGYVINVLDLLRSIDDLKIAISTKSAR